MAEVFLARQTGLGGFDREVVIKRILPGLALDTSFVDMFLQEARLAARLSHPNVVQIFDVGKEMDQYFIVMEFVRGRDLNALLKASLRQKVPCPPATAAHIAADIARGLSAAHSYTDAAGKPQPIVHRDVSPHNVLISFHGHVKITDFGIAKAHDSSNVTPTSLLKGKVSYMAPEQLVNARQPPDPRSDIFALGLVLYQLLTLVHPYKKDSEVATFRSLMEEAPHAPSTIVPGLSPEIDRICNHALAKNPAARYQTAKELEEDLEKFIVSRGTAVSAFDVAQWLGSLPEMGPREAELPGVAAPAREGTAQTKVSKS
jgi:serine/threonine-protein kinase